jgi:hypothetical protein
VKDSSEKEAYLAFAHELAVVQRSSFIVHRSRPQVPDYSQRTKNVVAKWFRRGLSGHLMLVIGEVILGKVRMTKSE